MKYILILAFLFLSIHTNYAQGYDAQRIQDIETKLESLVVDVPGLTEKIDVDIQNTTLATFLISISEIHKINIDVSNELASTNIINNFKNVPVSDVLIYLCKTYALEIDFTGTILSIKRYTPEPEEPLIRVIPITYNPNDNTLSADLLNDNIVEALKMISDKSGKGLFFTDAIKNTKLSGFIKDMPFEIAMEKIAFSNNLIVTKTKDGSFEFESLTSPVNGQDVQSPRPRKNRRSNFFFEVVDKEALRLNVDFENVTIADVIHDIGVELQLDIFMATPLDEAGIATVKATDISFDQLLTKIFESGEGAGVSAQNQSNNPRGAGQQQSNNTKRFTFKKEDGVYYFGTFQQITLRTAEIIPLRYRAIEFLSDPQRSGRSVGRTVGFNSNSGFGNNFNNNGGLNNNTSARNQNPSSQTARPSEGNSQSILDIIPDDISTDLNITLDKELNSFIVSGPSLNVTRFRDFIKSIDKPVPVIIIEVMILEVSKSTTLDAGIEWGLGTEAVTDQGQLFPSTDITLGATTVNRILGRIDGSSIFNIGTVLPNFYANIKANESNGNIKVRSSPRIATLNGHRAYFSNGQTSYYAVTNQTFFGSQNPTTSEIRNYQPIDAELSLDIKPFVSEDGIITMDIKVIQSNFNGERIAEDAPPGINSREFTSIVRVRNNDIFVLGGLEEKRKNDSGSGVPFLARIPVIKWLFSKRIREDRKSKLTVLIKPTVIY